MSKILWRTVQSIEETCQFTNTWHISNSKPDSESTSEKHVITAGLDGMQHCTDEFADLAQTSKDANNFYEQCIQCTMRIIGQLKLDKTTSYQKDKCRQKYAVPFQTIMHCSGVCLHCIGVLQNSSWFGSSQQKHSACTANTGFQCKLYIENVIICNQFTLVRSFLAHTTWPNTFPWQCQVFSVPFQLWN